MGARRWASLLLAGLALGACSHRKGPAPAPIRCADAGLDAAPPPPVTVDEGCGPLLPEEVVYDFPYDDCSPSSHVPVFSEAVSGVVYFDVIGGSYSLAARPDAEILYCVQLTRYRLEPAAGVIAAVGRTCLTPAVAIELLAPSRADPARYYHCRITGDFEVHIVPVTSRPTRRGDVAGCTSEPGYPFVYVHDRATGELVWSEGPALEEVPLYHCYYPNPVLVARPDPLGCCDDLRGDWPRCGAGCGDRHCGADYGCSPPTRYVSDDDGYCHEIGTEPL